MAHAEGEKEPNIRPKNTILAGVSIANHLTQPLSFPYFTSAAMESGNQLTFTDAVSLADAQSGYDALLKGLGCSSLDCLLALNTSQLINAPVYVHASPVVDGVNLVDFPRRLLKRGKVKRVPTIVGAARDEVSTRILGRRTAPLSPFLITDRAPHGVTPRS